MEVEFGNKKGASCDAPFSAFEAVDGYAIAFCKFSSTLSRKPSVVSHF
jgi:hypothetical protein